MSLDEFARRLTGDERAVAKDESRLQRDTSKEDAFASKLGGGPDMRLAQNDAGGMGGSPNPGDAATVRQALAPSMADYGGPQMGAPPGGPSPGENMAFGPGANPVGISDRFKAAMMGTPPDPHSVPLSQTPQAMGLPAGHGGPAPNFITNPTPYQDPAMGWGKGPPAYMTNPGAPPPMSVPGGGGGGGDFGVGAANKGVLGTYDEQRAHMQDASNQHAAAQGELANTMDNRAAFMAQRAKEAEQHAEITAQKHTEYLQASDKLNDAYAKGEIDPNRAFHNADTGTKVAMGIAAFLGAIVPGVKPLSKLIFGSAEDDVAAQKEAYDRKGASLKNRDTLFGHFMKVSGDSQLAKLQSTNALIDSQKVAMESQAMRLGIPEALSNAKVGVDVLNREQKMLQKQIAERAQQTASAHAGAVMAAQQKAQEQLWQHQMDVAKLGLSKDELALKAREVDGKAKPQTEFEKKQEETAAELAGHLAALSPEHNDPNSGGGVWDTGWTHVAPGWAPGVDSAKKGLSDRQAHNVKLMSAGGAAYRWGSGGMEPKSIDVIKEQMAPFEWEPGDDAKTRAIKDANFREHLKLQAAGKGVAYKAEALPDYAKPVRK